jgi:putative transposase
MVERDDDRITRTNGMSTWRAGCAETCTSGSEGGPEKPTGGNPGRALRSDPYTYVRTWAGMCYVAFVVDVFAQRIVGWHAMTTRPAELVLVPLRMAAWARGQDGHPVMRGELICHSDAGSQYCAIRVTEHLALEGITPSVGSVGDALDNALMETIIGLYKTECVRPGPFHTRPFKTLADVEYATMAWVDWYNHRRLHTTLDMATPAEHEAAHHAALHPGPQPV